MNILKLCPECKDYIWGGEKPRTKYGKQTNFGLKRLSWAVVGCANNNTNSLPIIPDIPL